MQSAGSASGYLDDHPEDYGEYFAHKKELSPEDYS